MNYTEVRDVVRSLVNANIEFENSRNQNPYPSCTGILEAVMTGFVADLPVKHQKAFEVYIKKHIGWISEKV